MKNSQDGVSSMIVLILVVLLILVGWEVGAYARLFSKTGNGNSAPAIQKTFQNCIGSKTVYDCYDQDEGTDFVDDAPPPENVILGWRDDGKP